MSVNVLLSFTVTGLTDEAQARAVVSTLAELMRDERIEDEVGLGWSLEDGRYFVTGETDYPLCVSRFYRWRPEFESSFHRRVVEVAPEAVKAVAWGYPDEDD
ncbi:hypothetical protein ABZ721_15065 [Streptomyces sp. NPDC006733]|uniref:hypothetical protein n=1 Tax=Streptomyces sp. NPDC006733 TaxID=3155460 RepID=UPI0033DA12BE